MNRDEFVFLYGLNSGNDCKFDTPKRQYRYFNDVRVIRRFPDGQFLIEGFDTLFRLDRENMLLLRSDIPSTVVPRRWLKAFWKFFKCWAKFSKEELYRQRKDLDGKWIDPFSGICTKVLNKYAPLKKHYLRLDHKTFINKKSPKTILSRKLHF